MKQENIEDGGERQRKASDAAAESGGSPSNEAAGAQKRGTLEDWERSAEPGNEASDQPPSNEAAGTQVRGTREDWDRSAGPGSAPQAAAGAPSTAGESSEPNTDDSPSKRRDA